MSFLKNLLADPAVKAALQKLYWAAVVVVVAVLGYVAARLPVVP